MTMPIPKKVVDYLKEVKYGNDDTSYIPSVFALEMLNLILIIVGDAINVTYSTFKMLIVLLIKLKRYY